MFGIDFSEYQLDVPSNSTQRVGLKSSGVRVSLKAVLPSTTARAWLLGVEFIPNLKHKEVATGINLQTGTSNRSSTIGFSFGRSIVFDRKNKIYLKLSHRIEKNLFEGVSSQADPITGSTPDGSAVTNSTTIFGIGFTWGH